jgi:hypothetical protein
VIPVQRLEYLPQSFVAVILLIPHVLVILDFSVSIQCQRDEGVDLLGDGHGLWGVFLLQFENDGLGLGFDNLGFDCLSLGHDHGYSCIAVNDGSMRNVKYGMLGLCKTVAWAVKREARPVNTTVLAKDRLGDI